MASHRGFDPDLESSSISMEGEDVDSETPDPTRQTGVELTEKNDFFSHYAAMEGRFDLLDKDDARHHPLPTPANRSLAMTVIEHPSSDEDNGDYQQNNTPQSHHSAREMDHLTMQGARSSADESGDELVSESVDSSSMEIRRTQRSQSDQPRRSDRAIDARKRVKSRVKAGGSAGNELSTLVTSATLKKDSSEEHSALVKTAEDGVIVRNAAATDDESDRLSESLSHSYSIPKSQYSVATNYTGMTTRSDMVPPLRDGSQSKLARSAMDVDGSAVITTTTAGIVGSDAQLTRQLQRMLDNGDDLSKVELLSVEAGTQSMFEEAQLNGDGMINGRPRMESMPGDHSDEEDDGNGGGLFGWFSSMFGGRSSAKKTKHDSKQSKNEKRKVNSQRTGKNESNGFDRSKREKLLAPIELDMVGRDAEDSYDEPSMQLSSDNSVKEYDLMESESHMRRYHELGDESEAGDELMNRLKMQLDHQSRRMIDGHFSPTRGLDDVSDEINSLRRNQPNMQALAQADPNLTDVSRVIDNFGTVADAGLVDLLDERRKQNDSGDIINGDGHMSRMDIDPRINDDDSREQSAMPMERYIDKNGREVVSIDDLINDIGFGRFHYELLGLCGLGYVCDSLWGETITLVMQPVQNEWDIDTRYLGYFPSLLFLGMCIGGLFWGRISDVIGRRKPFTLTLAISGLSGILMSMSPSYGWTLLLCISLGFGLGGAIPVDGAILAEFLPASHRGSFLVSLSIFWSLGEFVSCIFAVLLVPHNSCDDRKHCPSEKNLGWRLLVFACSIINCLMLLFRLSVSESPNFLICQGEAGRARALDVLKTIAEINGCPEKVNENMVLVSASERELSEEENGGHQDTTHKRWIEIVKELFDDSTPHRNLRLATPLIWLSWFGSSFGLTMFGVFLPKFLDRKHIQLSNIYGDALIFAALALPGPFIGSMMVESSRFGRRYTMALAALFNCLWMLSFVFSSTEEWIVFFAGMIGLFSQIFYAGLMCFTPEAYPTDIRTTASGIASGVRHLANILGPIVGANTFGDSALYTAAFAILVAAIAAACLPFDTRKRRLVSTVRLSV